MGFRDGAACRHVSFSDEEHSIGDIRHTRAKTLRKVAKVFGKAM